MLHSCTACEKDPLQFYHQDYILFWSFHLFWWPMGFAAKWIHLDFKRMSQDSYQLCYTSAASFKYPKRAYEMLQNRHWFAPYWCFDQEMKVWHKVFESRKKCILFNGWKYLSMISVRGLNKSLKSRLCYVKKAKTDCVRTDFCLTDQGHVTCALGWFGPFTLWFCNCSFLNNSFASNFGLTFFKYVMFDYSKSIFIFHILYYFCFSSMTFENGL